jgi:bifunctional non-homologous end joining protein LigD
MQNSTWGIQNGMLNTFCILNSELTEMPDVEYVPQLATLTKIPPSGDQWVHEIKLDGYRVGCLITGGRIRLVSRRGLDWTPKFPEIVEAFRALGLKNAIIDGELVIMLPNGRSSFEAMQRAVASRPPRKDLVYFAFDLIQLEGQRIDRLPLEARKARLQRLLGTTKTGRIRYTEHVEGRGSDVFDQACRMGVEGIISKRRDLPYHPGRHDSWRKIKCLQRGLFVIGGFTDQEGAQEGLGALLVGRYDGNTLVYSGRVGTGFTQAVSRDLRNRLEAIEQGECPFDPPPPGPLVRTAHWVEPALVCEATFIERTAAGVLRAPSFQGLRPTIKAKDVSL